MQMPMPNPVGGQKSEIYTRKHEETRRHELKINDGHEK
jgi:hypothetical protein